MDIAMLTDFFMWCTIINGGLFALGAVLFRFAPDWVYGVQSKQIPISRETINIISRETFNVVMYAFLGFFKIVFLVFNLVPYVALLIIG